MGFIVDSVAKPGLRSKGNGTSWRSQPLCVATRCWWREVPCVGNMSVGHFRSSGSMIIAARLVSGDSMKNIPCYNSVADIELSEYARRTSRGSPTHAAGRAFETG